MAACAPSRRYVLLLFPNAIVLSSQANEENSEARARALGRLRWRDRRAPRKPWARGARRAPGLALPRRRARSRARPRAQASIAAMGARLAHEVRPLRGALVGGALRPPCGCYVGRARPPPRRRAGLAHAPGGGGRRGSPRRAPAQVRNFIMHRCPDLASADASVGRLRRAAHDAALLVGRCSG
jgi:hypothetical protein